MICNEISYIFIQPWKHHWTTTSIYQSGAGSDRKVYFALILAKIFTILIKGIPFNTFLCWRYAKSDWSETELEPYHHLTVKKTSKNEVLPKIDI